MRTNATALVLLMVSAATISAGPEPTKSSPLTTPFDPPLESLLVEHSQPRVAVLVPDDPDYAQLARRFVSRFAQVTGVTLPTVPETRAVGETPGVTTLVVFGNVATGPLARRMYANKLIAADGAYPGPDGFELRTIPLALDTGANVLFLGGSSPQAVTAAMDAFFAELKPGKGISILFTIRWVSTARAAPRPLSDEEIGKRAQSASDQLQAFRTANQYQIASGVFCQAAADFYLSGDDSYGKLCAHLVNVLADHYANNETNPPTFVMHNIVMALDQVEENAGMSPQARLKAAEWIRKMVEDTMVFWEMRDPVRRYANGELRPIWNHQTHPALSIAHAAQYLKSHYRVEAADYWAAVVENLFRGQTTCDQPLEDSANYQWSVPRHTSAYVLATGRLRDYFTNGLLQQSLEYTLASHDAQGNEATHGDAWQPFGSVARGLLAIATAQYGDPRYRWLLERTGSRVPSVWSYALTDEASPPANHVGLKVFTVHPERVAAYGIEGIPPERCLDKAVFRSGWDPDSEYLMLDGLNVGNHKHLDANAIIRYSINRRYWLVDMDYIRAAPKHHNSIAVVRDGLAPDQSPASNRDAQVIAAPPLAAELLHSTSAGDRAMTQSLLADYRGLDWRRSLFWKAEDFLVVIDQLTALAEGDYVVRCFWRTLGDARIEGSRLQVTQQGEHSVGNDVIRVVEDAGRSVVEFFTRASAMEFERELEAGTYRVILIAKGTSGGSDSLYVQVDGGKRLAHHIPIDSYGDSAANWEKTTSGPSIILAESGNHHFEISLREGPGPRLDRVALVPDGGKPIILEGEEIVKEQVEVIDEPEQHFFIANGDGSPLKLRQTFDYGHGGRDGYYAQYPYAGKMTNNFTQTKTRHLREGESVTFANLFYTRGGDPRPPRELRRLNERAWVVTGETPALLGFGPQKQDGFEIDEGMLMLTQGGICTAGVTRGSRLRQSEIPALVVRLAGETKPAPQPAVSPTPSAPELPKRWDADFDSPVSALAAAPEGILCGTEAGVVALLDTDGKPKWSNKLGSRVRTVTFANLRKDLTVCVAGTHRGEAVAFEASNGAKLWSYECEPYHGRTGFVATIFPADLDGDGFDEVIAGSDNHHYHGLSAGGKLLWRTNTVHASTVGCSGDRDSDGKDEIMAGTEYYWPRLLGPTGKIIGRLSGGPVTSAVGCFDINGDGKAEPFYGMEDCFVRCVGADGKVAWKANVGGAPTAIEPLDVDGDGTPEVICGSESFSVYAIDADGKIAWRTQLPEEVKDVTVLSDRVAVACDDGRVYLLDRHGHVTAQTELPDAPRCVAAMSADTFVVSSGNRITAIGITH